MTDTVQICPECRSFPGRIYASRKGRGPQPNPLNRLYRVSIHSLGSPTPKVLRVTTGYTKPRWWVRSTLTEAVGSISSVGGDSVEDERISLVYGQD
jgi:hypothetical protein